MAHWKKYKSNHAGKSCGWNSSGDETSGSAYTKKQMPAASAQDALWRVSRRIGAAWRWLKLDLSLLAESDHHKDVIESIEKTIVVLGSHVLPEYGVSPISAEKASQPETLELVSILSCIKPEAGNNIGSHTSESTPQQGSNYEKHDVRTKFIPSQTSGADEKCNVNLQTVGQYMVRNVPADVDGDGVWIPLTYQSMRRCGILRCSNRAHTNSESACNFRLDEGAFCKIVEIDDDDDLQMVVLSCAGHSNLWAPSEPRWLLKDSYWAFEIWMPGDAFAAQQAHSVIQAEEKQEDDG